MPRRAGPKFKLSPQVLNQMEGLLSEGKNGRTPVDPTTWVMTACLCSLQTVQRWAARQTSSGVRPHLPRERDAIEQFADLFSQLQALAAAEPVKVIHAMSSDKETPPPQRLAASKWCAETSWPARYGPNARPLTVNLAVDQPSEREVSDMSDAEVAEFTNAELAEIESIQAAIVSGKERMSVIRASVRKRAAPNDPELF